MAMIDVRERTLLLKLVYCGPAMGGKTTNLRSLHGFLDSTKRPELLSLDTHGDRTLFFDLLPLELDDVGGLKLKVRLFTVPGQVHYNATRRLVLRDVDAVVVVADSTEGRLEANAESIRSLHDNFVANGLPAGSVPIFIQANKRDVADAVSLVEVEESLQRDAMQLHARAIAPGLIPAAAVNGMGVFETFERTLRAAVAAAHGRQKLDRIGVTREALGFALFEALAPMRTRAAAAATSGCATAAAEPAKDLGAVRTISPEAVLPAEQLFAESVNRSLDLAESLGDTRALRASLDRRVRELETVQELSRVLVKATTAREVAKAAAVAAQQALGPGGAASFMLLDEDGRLTATGLAGFDRDPLLDVGDPPLAVAIHGRGRAVMHRDIAADLVHGDPRMISALAPWCTLVASPVDLPCGGRGLIVAHGIDPEAPADRDALRFVGMIAAQAALGLQAVARHLSLVRHGERLEAEVASRTEELRAAHGELAASSRLKDRVLSSINHELRTPVTKLLAAAQVIQRAKGAPVPPQMMQQVVDQARHLGGLLDQVLSAQALVSRPTADGDAVVTLDVARTLDAAVMSCQERAAARRVLVRIEPSSELPLACADPGAVTLVLAQLLDNAVKFTKTGSCVRVSTERSGAAWRVIVRDEGPGVPLEDAERIFSEFDQGGADVLTAKPTGLGLGLAIARRVARRFGGDVGAVVGRPGGSFWLELPMVPTHHVSPEDVSCPFAESEV